MPVYSKRRYAVPIARVNFIFLLLDLAYVGFAAKAPASYTDEALNKGETSEFYCYKMA